MNTLLAVAAGGAIGSVARYGVGIAAARWVTGGFPWGTLIVNVAGCFLMGIAGAFFATRAALSPERHAFFAVGVLGGFTTFSAFSADFAQLMENAAFSSAILYLVGSVALSLLAYGCGFFATRFGIL